MQAKKDYENLPDDGELLYMISDNNDETKFLISQKYKPVITYYANKYSTYVEGKGLDFNDLYQEGLIGLIGAVDSFKERKDIKFSTFAFLCIKRKILTAVKNANRKKHSILNESYSLDYTMYLLKNLKGEFLFSIQTKQQQLMVQNKHIYHLD